MAQRGGGPAEGGFFEPDGVLDVEPVGVGPPAQVQAGGGAGRAGPPQPQRVEGVAAGCGRPGYCHLDHPAAHDRCPGVAGPPVMPAAAAADPRVQPGPGAHGDGPIDMVLGGQLPIGGAPGRGVLQVEPGAMAGWRAVGVRAARRRVVEEHPVLVQPHQHLHAVTGQCVAQPRGVIAGAGVKDEQRHRPGTAKAGRHAADLGDGSHGRILPGIDPPRIHRPGPRITAKTQLRDLLVAPARHHRLAMGLAGGVVVQPPPRRGLGRGTRPGRGIHREHQRPASRPVCGQQAPEPSAIGPAFRQRRIPAAMPAAHDRLQRQPGQRAHRPARAQHSIGQLKQRIRPRPQAPIPPRPEPRQPPPRRRIHPRSCR